MTVFEQALQKENVDDLLNPISLLMCAPVLSKIVFGTGTPHRQADWD